MTAKKVIVHPKGSTKARAKVKEEDQRSSDTVCHLVQAVDG